MDLPPGFRFHPTDEELITHYLSRKIADRSFISAVIREFDLNKCEPWDLPLEAKMGDEWYFFCTKDRKYPTGLRTNRATDSGYWKATGKDKEIHKRKVLIGMKKTLVFYRGRAPKGKKTSWVMHEYRMEGKHTECNEWVICRVFYRISAEKDMEFVKVRSWFADNDISLHRAASTDNQHKNKASCAFDMKHVTCFSDTQVIENGHKELLATSYNNPIGISSLNSSVSGYLQTLQDATNVTNIVETNSDNNKLLYKPESDLFSILNFQSENVPCLRTSHVNKDFMYYQSS